MFTLTVRGSTLDDRFVYRRQILTTKVDPHTVRVQFRFDALESKELMALYCMRSFPSVEGVIWTAQEQGEVKGLHLVLRPFTLQVRGLYSILYVKLKWIFVLQSTVDLVIFACLNFLEFLILWLFTKYINNGYVESIYAL